MVSTIFSRPRFSYRFSVTAHLGPGALTSAFAAVPPLIKTNSEKCHIYLTPVGKITLPSINVRQEKLQDECYGITYRNLTSLHLFVIFLGFHVVETGLERAGLTSVSEVDTTSLILYHREQSQAAAIRSAHESIYLSHVSLSVA